MDILAILRQELKDRYDIERELGGGGMSRVFLAREIALSRRVVLKLLPAELTADLSIARFQREIAIAAKLQHPHIVPLLGTGDVRGMPYFTMPFVDGESLRDRLAREGELPIADTIRLLRAIAAAIGYAHQQGVVHRDLKPENILLTGGIAAVTDFGVAKALLDATAVDRVGLTAEGVAVGTPTYMAPEQVSADPATDHRADLYAFGIVAYEMLAGRTPFVARTTQAMLAAHVIEVPEPVLAKRPSAPVSLANLVMRCLEKRAADRPQSADEIVRELDQLTSTTGVIAAVPPARPTSPPAPMNASRRVAMALFVATVIIGGIWFGTRGRAGADGDASSPAASSRVLVVPFENLTGDPRFEYIGRIAADRLANTIAQLGASDVVPPSTVLLALDDSAGGRSARLKRLADATHAGLLVSGSVLLRGDSLVVQAQVTEAHGDKVIVTIEPSSGLAADPVAAIDALGDRLLGALGRRRDLRVLSSGFRAPKYAAYQAFAEGFEKFARLNDNRGARADFERAIAIDSTYVQAYQLLFRQYVNAGEYERADSLWHRTERIPGVRTATERAQSLYGRAVLDGDLPGMLRAAEQLVGGDSAGVPLFLVGETSVYLMRPTLAVRVMQAAESSFAMIGGQATRNHVEVLTEAYHELGAHDKELATWTQWRSAYPDEWIPRARSLRAYAGSRRGAEAVAIADSALTASADPRAVVLPFVVGAGEEFAAHGDSSTARQLWAAAGAWFAAHPAATPTLRRTIAEARLFLSTRRLDSAAVRWRALATDTAQVEPAGVLGLIDALRGDHARARVVADSLGALQRPYLFGEHTYWRAAILATLGDRPLAVQLLRQAHEEGLPLETWHARTELASLRGDPGFKALIAVRPEPR